MLCARCDREPVLLYGRGNAYNPYFKNKETET